MIPLNNARYALTIAFVAVLFVSCRPGTEIVRGPLENRSSDELWNSLNDLAAFGSLSAKVHVDFDQNGKSQSFNCKLRMREDSALWVSIAPLLGIEIFRMVITTDSVKLVDRLNKRYFADSLTVLETMTQVPVSFQLLQSLLTGKMVNLYPPSRYRTIRMRDHYQLSMRARGKLRREFKRSMLDVPLLHQMSVSRDGDMLLGTFLKDLSTGNLIRTEYSDFEKIGGRNIATETDIQTAGSGRVTCKLKWSRINVEEPVSLPFSIPEKYEPISGE